MKIGMVLGSFYPEDIRVTKEATALSDNGHELFLLCLRRKNENYSEIKNRIKITRINAGKSIYIKALFDTLNALFWRYPVFKRKLSNFIKDNDIDILHVHDLPLTNTVYKAAQKNNVPVILDMHENYPAGLATWSEHKKNIIVKIKNSLFFNYNRWFKYEQRMVHKVDGIISVVDEMKEKICYTHKVSSEKVVTVTNSEPRAFLDNKVFKSNIAENYKDSFNIVYIGGLGPHRGIDTAILGIKILKNKIPDIKLLLIGKGSIKKSLMQLVRKHNLQEYVVFIDFQPFENVFTFMKLADINIIPHKRNEHTNNTIPHKLYQSLMTGKPLLVSDCDPLKRIVDEIQGGFIFKAEDPDSFAERIIYIKNNQQEREFKSRNGTDKTIKGIYNWDTDSQKLVSFYQRFKANR